MTGGRHIVGAVLVLTAGAPALAAQDPLAVTIKLECPDWGQEVPRAGEATPGYALIGHDVRWWIGATRLPTPDLLRAELARLRGEFGAQALELTLLPRPQTCVWELVLTLDRMAPLGVTACTLGGSPVPVRLRRTPAPAGPALIPPIAQHPQPLAEKTWQPGVRLDQQGRLHLGEEVLFDPDREGDTVAAAVARLVDLPHAHAVRIAAPDGREVTDAELLVVADRWAEAHWLLELARACAAPGGFRALALGVTEVDHEAELLRKRFGR